MRYPHLGKGNQQFPHLGNVQPFERVTDFDYGRYDYEASIRLCKVPWDSHYAHVVNWASASARDAWFESNAGEPLALTGGVLRTQTDRVVLDVPYDVALTYNYAYLQVPQMTSEDPIDHEELGGIRTICAFVTGCEYFSPSTTELTLDVDVWTTYLPHLACDALYLERGHAPMYATSVDAYLADPINNCRDLLTPDVNYGVASIVRGHEYNTLSSATYVLVMASTIPGVDIDSIVRASAVTPAGPSYYDVAGARDGHQVGVTGYTYGSASYAGMTSPSQASGASGSLMTGLTYYAISTSDVLDGALDDIFSLLPVFATSIQAAYVVPSNLVILDTTHTIGTRTLRECSTLTRWARLTDMRILKSHFNYPEKYADIAKLYTAPYAMLEFSNDNGQVIQVNVEDTHGNIACNQLVSTAWPFLHWELALSNIENTTTAKSYIWRNLDNTTVSKSSYANDFSRIVLDYDIPTYALYLDGKTSEAVASWYEGQQTREHAILTYQSSMRSANTALANALDSNATAKTNADASADTAKTNADASADTAKTNADASADTAKTNADASADTAKTNTTNTNNNIAANTTAQNNNRTLVTTANNATSLESKDASNTHITEAQSGNIDYARDALDINLKSEAVSAISNAVGNAIEGNTAGVVMAGVSGIVNMTTQAALEYASEVNIGVQAVASRKENTLQQGYRASNATTTTGYANSLATTLATNNTTTSNTNATNTQTTAKANATRTQTTAKANATRTQTTAKANAASSNTTAKANSARTKSTGDANATYTRNTGESNAKQALVTSQDAYNSKLTGAGMRGPTSHGAYAGSGIHEAMQERGIHMRVKTQPDGCIARAGDAMIRYGYSYDGMWSVSSWCPTGHDYCYWRSNDVPIRADACDNMMALDAFRDMLSRGITVWASPAKVGRF